MGAADMPVLILSKHSIINQVARFKHPVIVRSSRRQPGIEGALSRYDSSFKSTKIIDVLRGCESKYRSRVFRAHAALEALTALPFAPPPLAWLDARLVAAD